MTEYAYDHRNRWVRKILDPGGLGEEKTIFVYDGNQIALRFHDTGTADLTSADLKNRYLWGPSVDQILSDEQVTGPAEGEVLWPLTDHLGTVRDVIDSAGNVKIHRIFNAFGEFTEPIATRAHQFAFTGRPFDYDTWLQNNVHRWYDVFIGRWASEDPVGFDGGDANVYRYVLNRPTNLVDPSGLSIPFDLNPLPPYRQRTKAVGSSIVYAMIKQVMQANQLDGFKPVHMAVQGAGINNTHYQFAGAKDLQARMQQVAKAKDPRLGRIAVLELILHSKSVKMAFPRYSTPLTRENARQIGTTQYCSARLLLKWGIGAIGVS